MAYRNKEDCLREAKRLGIDVTGMTWPQLQAAVSNAVKQEQGAKPRKKQAKQKPVKKLSQEQRNLMPYLGKTILLSPELAPERYRLVKYDEVLGNEIDVEERVFDMDDNDRVFDKSGGNVDYDNIVDEYHDYTTGTFRIKKRGDRKVVAMSSVPKENAGMMFRPGIDYATVVTWRGRAGYLWKHWRYPNVKALLMQSGHYQEYKHLFKDEPNVWYAAGKQLVCDVNLVHRVFQEIQEKEARKAEEDRMRMEHLRNGGYYA